MSNAEVYIEKYKTLESVVRSTYGLKDQDSISHYLSSKNTKFRMYANEIQYCQKVRNLLSHQNKISDEYPIEPSNSMITFIDTLIKQIQNKPRCCDIMIPRKDVYFQNLAGNVNETMHLMQEKMFTHIPIVENDKVIGVFDENSVFMYLANQENSLIHHTLTFRDIKQYIQLADREMEEFLFFPETKLVEELEYEFESAFQRGKRIGIVFITQNGNFDESLQGIITPWDILAVKG